LVTAGDFLSILKQFLSGALGVTAIIEVSFLVILTRWYVKSSKIMEILAAKKDHNDCYYIITTIKYSK